MNIIDLVVLAKFEKSKSEVRRLIKGKAVKINNQIVEDEKFQITDKIFNDNYLKLSIGKKRHVRIRLILFFLIFSKVLVINLGVNVFIGFTVVSSFFGGPLILKLTPKTPSPVFFPTNIFPTTGIEPITLFTVVAGTNVPLRLINLPFSTYPSIKIEIAGPMA